MEKYSINYCKFTKKMGVVLHISKKNATFARNLQKKNIFYKFYILSQHETKQNFCSIYADCSSCIYCL